MIDTSLLIEYFRKTDKHNAKLVTHFKNYNHIFISSITEFEILNGAKQAQLDFWEGILFIFKNYFFSLYSPPTYLVELIMANTKVAMPTTLLPIPNSSPVVNAFFRFFSGT